MRHMKTEIVPATTREVEDKVACDLCGADINRQGYEIDEVTVKHRMGSSYPECGSGEEVITDICGQCFDKKMVPWLKSQGAEPRIEKWRW